LEPIEKKENLSEEEKVIYDSLFTENQSLTVTDKNHQKFSKAISNLTDSLQANWKLTDYFLKNRKYVAWGTMLAAVLFVFYVFCVGKIPLGATILFTVPFIGLAIMSMTEKRLGKGCLALVFKLVGFTFLGFLSLFALISVLMLSVTLLIESWAPGAFILSLSIMYVFYIYLIKAPTKLGAQTASELDGFKMYLETAEENRLNLLTPPERTPELFEKLLPYAIALGVENKWGKKFTNVLKKANYNPDWYDGDKPFTSSRFPSTFARSFTSSVSSARINPAKSSSSGGSWSSGSSGGGSSGGGGGGGGGRGW
jgi:uncharacterized membrane protein